MGCSPTSLASDELLRRSLTRLAALHGGQQHLPTTARNETVLRHVRDYLHDHVGDAVSVRELAAVASMSRFRLTRQFQKTFAAAACLPHACPPRGSQATAPIRRSDCRGGCGARVCGSEPFPTPLQGSIWRQSRSLAEGDCRLVADVNAPAQRSKTVGLRWRMVTTPAHGQLHATSGVSRERAGQLRTTRSHEGLGRALAAGRGRTCRD